MSGSEETCEDDSKDAPKSRLISVDKMQVDKVMEQILNLSWIEKEFAAMPIEPSYVLNISKSTVWLYSVTRRGYFEVPNMSEIITVDKVSDDVSHCMINNDLFEVSNDLIQCIGWN
jgi:hypothetical protein